MNKPLPAQHPPSPAPRLDQVLVPASNAAPIFATAVAHGLDCGALADEAGVDMGHIEDDESWHTAEKCIGLMQQVANHIGADALGYELGLRTPPTAHGVYGLGLLSTATPWEALDMGVRYFQLRNPTYEMRWSADNDVVTVEWLDLFPKAPLRRTSMAWVMLSTVNLADAMFAGSPEGFRQQCELHLPWPEPSCHAAYAARLPVHCFDADKAMLQFPAALLHQSLGGHAPASVRLADKACARDLAHLPHRTSTRLRVLRLMAPDPRSGRYPDQQHVAHGLHLTLSTLKRRLADEGTSFSQVQTEARYQEAQRLLRHPGLSIDEIAARLGFQNPANFARAFRRWSGHAPSAWRLLGHGRA